MASLDVVNLYGSIPLESDNNIKGIFDAFSEFVDQHREETLVNDMCALDLKVLLRLALCSDKYIMSDKAFIQTCGIPMGNPAAPLLATVYMHMVESRIMSVYPHVKLWKRYVDDVFVLIDTTGDLQQLLNDANSINRCIQFTMEEPVDNTIPFLDVMVKANYMLDTFSFQLYVKPLHSGCMMPSTSAVPQSRKESILANEINRAVRNSSGPDETIESLRTIQTRFAANGYTRRQIDRAMRRCRGRTNTTNPTTYLRLPYIDESYCRQVRQLLNRTALSNHVRVCFQTRPPLKKLLRPRRTYTPCPDACTCCLACKDRNKFSCQQKLIIYKISCLICQAVYIGESQRTFRSRWLDHMRDDASHVKQHIKSHSEIVQAEAHLSFRWEILATERNFHARKATEALFIRNSHETLMNGCEGKRVLSFL